MKTFSYKINDEVGIHARPAGMLAKTAGNFSSEIIIEKDGKKVNALKLIAVMGLGIKYGDVITVYVNGSDEDAAAKAVKDFLNNNL